jgi:hypothetical protein
MRFRFRLLYYLSGFGIGLMFLFFILSGKDARCSYFPNARVLNNLSSKPFHYSENASKVLAESWIDTTDIKNTLKYGDVDFDRSKVKFHGGKLYFVEGKTTKNVPITLEVLNYEDKAILREIKRK